MDKQQQPSATAARAHVDAYLARWERFELSRVIVGKLYWDLIDAVLPAYAAERERAARAEALEQACKAVCHRCADGIEARREGGDWYHGWGVDGRRNGPCYAGNIRVLMSEPEEAKPAGVVHRYAVTRVDDFGDAWQVHWEAEDHGGRATIAKSQLPGCTPTPGATVELSFDVLGGFLGGRIIDQIVEAVPCSNS